MSIQGLVDHLEREVQLSREPGLEVELGHFLRAGWCWSYQDEAYLVLGPDDEDWNEEVRRLMARLEYHHASLRQKLGQRRYKLVTWRRDARGFVVWFGVTSP